MKYISETPENVKAKLAREFAEAQRAADAFMGPSPRDHYRGHCRFDLVDGIPITKVDESVTGILTHDVEHCPYCRLRDARRAFAVFLAMEKGPGHGKIH